MIDGLWVNPRHGHGPQDQVTALAKRGTRHITYEVLGVKVTDTIHVCDGCDRSKAKARDVINKTYTILPKQGESISVDTTGPFTEILIGNRYWVGVVDDYSRYSWSFFTKTKSQLLEKME